jgi:radical SAM protein with 4Fe4S-binding SPASM domain
MRQYSNVVLPNGDVSVCCSDFGLKHILGNLLTTKLSDIHKSEKMKDFNRKMDDGDENFICNRCSYSRLMRPEDEDNLSVWYRLHPNEETGEGEWDQTRSQIFEPDMSDGQHQYDHPNGKVWWIYSCKDKKFVGKFERYRIDGITECIGEFDENGEKHGKWIGFYHTGEQEYEENYKNGIREGFYRKWFYDGIVEFEGNYKNGKEDGTWNYGIPFPSDGKIMRKRKNYKNGKLNGIYEEWHPNGKIWKEYQYINDNKNSEWKEWYNNGNLKFKIQFKNNKMHGDYSEYHVNGLLRGKGKMKNNRMEGKWNFWFHNNIVEAEISCNNGRIISGKSFNDNGTIKKGREELWDDNSIKPSWI